MWKPSTTHTSFSLSDTPRKPKLAPWDTRSVAFVTPWLGVMRSQAMGAAIIKCIVLAGCAESKIDSCLDHGGSFNYEKCECDFKEGHEYKEAHSCK